MNSIPDQYHSWYYNEEVWKHTTFCGVRCLKSVSDMWNYQEIICQLKPSLVIEFGTYEGGSALYFAEILQMVSRNPRVLTVDIDHGKVPAWLKRNKRIEFLTEDTTSEVVAKRIRRLRSRHPGPAFFLLDSNHAQAHVVQELIQIRPLSLAGDYVVVEDGNINGHPVLPDWGPGPYEALEEYRARFPHDYAVDVPRVEKFGFTFAPNGFLKRL